MLFIFRKGEIGKRPESHSQSEVNEARNLDEILPAYKKRVEDILKSIPDNNTLEIDNLINENKSLLSFVTEVGIKLSNITDVNVEAQKEAFHIETLLITLEKENVIRRKDNKIIFDINSNSKRSIFLERLRHFGKRYLQDQKGLSRSKNAWQKIKEYLREHALSIIDVKGEKFEAEDVIDFGNFRALNVDYRKQILKFLEKNSVKRLRLRRNKEKIPVEEVDQYVDEENGYLCILEGKNYRKLSGEKDIHKIFGAEGSLWKELKKKSGLFDDPKFPIRRSDLGNLRFEFRPVHKVGGSYSTPMIDGLRYYFPRRFELDSGSDHSKMEIRIKANRDEVMKLSNEYAILVYNEAEKQNHILLKLLDEKNKKKLGKRTVNSAITVENMQFWDPGKFLKRFNNEDDTEYRKRISACEDINVLVSIGREILDNSGGFNLKKYDLRKQLLFATYYFNSSEKDKNLLCEKLRDFGEDFFNSFLACEFGWEMGEKIVEIAEFEEAKSIFQAYSKLAANAESMAMEIYEIYKEAYPSGNVTENEIRESILKGARGLLLNVHEKLANGEADQIQKIVGKVIKFDKNVQYTRELISALPRREVAQLNLDALTTVEINGPISTPKFLNKTKYKSFMPEIMEAIRRQFPEGDDEDFKNNFLRDPNADIYLITCAGKLLVFFGSTEMPENIHYFDWFIANPDAPVKGLGEAAITSFKRRFEENDCYAVCKPQVKSLPIAIERQGFVAYGVTNEYKHTYLRCRKMIDEKNESYLGKNLSKEVLEDIVNFRGNTNSDPESIIIGGKELKIARVQFDGKDHLDDVYMEGGKDAKIFEIMNELGNRGWVMSRYLMAKPFDRNVQTYVAIFEEGHGDEKTMDAVRRLRSSIKQKYSAGGEGEDNFGNENERAA